MTRMSSRGRGRSLLRRRLEARRSRRRARAGRRRARRRRRPRSRRTRRPNWASRSRATWTASRVRRLRCPIPRRSLSRRSVRLSTLRRETRRVTLPSLSLRPVPPTTPTPLRLSILPHSTRRRTTTPRTRTTARRSTTSRSTARWVLRLETEGCKLAVGTQGWTSTAQDTLLKPVLRLSRPPHKGRLTTPSRRSRPLRLLSTTARATPPTSRLRFPILLFLLHPLKHKRRPTLAR